MDGWESKRHNPNYDWYYTHKYLYIYMLIGNLSIGQLSNLGSQDLFLDLILILIISREIKHLLHLLMLLIYLKIPTFIPLRYNGQKSYLK